MATEGAGSEPGSGTVVGVSTRVLTLLSGVSPGVDALLLVPLLSLRGVLGTPCCGRGVGGKLGSAPGSALCDGVRGPRDSPGSAGSAAGGPRDSPAALLGSGGRHTSPPRLPELLDAAAAGPVSSNPLSNSSCSGMVSH